MGAFWLQFGSFLAPKWSPEPLRRLFSFWATLFLKNKHSVSTKRRKRKPVLAWNGKRVHYGASQALQAEEEQQESNEKCQSRLARSLRSLARCRARLRLARGGLGYRLARGPTGGNLSMQTCPSMLNTPVRPPSLQTLCYAMCCSFRILG